MFVYYVLMLCSYIMFLYYVLILCSSRNFLDPTVRSLISEPFSTCLRSFVRSMVLMLLAGGFSLRLAQKLLYSFLNNLCFSINGYMVAFDVP